MLAIFNRSSPVETTTPATQPVPVLPTEDAVLVMIRDIAIGQANMTHRITRIESRLVGLLLANGLDRNGKPGGERP